MAYSTPQSEKPQNIVCIGGGTGLSTLLRGIKQYVQQNQNNGEWVIDLDRLTAIIAVSDDGGSSGQIIHEFDAAIPPGDIRNCLVALAAEDQIFSRLFEHRFKTNGNLHGHSVGNLLLVTLAEIFGTFPRAIQEASRVLAVKGRILPVTQDQITLCAELEDGTIVRGESAIPKRSNRSHIKRVFLTRRGFAEDQPGHSGNGNGQNLYTPEEPICALPEALEAITNADAIIIGPGSLYTSVLPNLVVPGMADAIRQSQALRIYIANVMVEPGETDGYTITDHVRAIQQHANFHLDYVIANSQPAPEELLQQYLEVARHAAGQGEMSSICDPHFKGHEHSDDVRWSDDGLPRFPCGHCDHSKVQVLYCPLIDDVAPARLWEEDLLKVTEIKESGVTRKVLRHDPQKSAAAIMRVLRSHHSMAESNPLYLQKAF